MYIYFLYSREDISLILLKTIKEVIYIKHLKQRKYSVYFSVNENMRYLKTKVSFIFVKLYAVPYEQ